MADIGTLDLQRTQIVPRGRHYLQVIWIQAPSTKVVQGVMVTAEQKSIAAPVAAIVAHWNDVCCLYNFWWGIA